MACLLSFGVQDIERNQCGDGDPKAKGRRKECLGNASSNGDRSAQLLSAKHSKGMDHPGDSPQQSEQRSKCDAGIQDGEPPVETIQLHCCSPKKCRGEDIPSMS